MGFVSEISSNSRKNCSTRIEVRTGLEPLLRDSIIDRKNHHRFRRRNLRILTSPITAVFENLAPCRIADAYYRRYPYVARPDQWGTQNGASISLITGGPDGLSGMNEFDVQRSTFGCERVRRRTHADLTLPQLKLSVACSLGRRSIVKKREGDKATLPASKLSQLSQLVESNEPTLVPPRRFFWGRNRCTNRMVLSSGPISQFLDCIIWKRFESAPIHPEAKSVRRSNL